MAQQAMEITANSGPMTVDVLHLINEARMTYGLRHQDYQRYREYCTNRIHRLRQILKLAQSNNKTTNVQKPVPETFQDPRYLHLFIYESERAWAFAMELKQESANSMETRQRHHLVKRLKRAVKHSQALYDICEKQSVDGRTVLDVKAYASLMKGYLYFEQQHWQEALNQFVESRTIYERFAQDNSNAEQEALCFSAIDEIDPNIRFCAYKLQMNQDIATLVTDLKDDQLQAQLAKIKSTSSNKQAVKTLTWRSHEFTIKNTALAQAVIKAQNTRASAQLEHGAVAAFDSVLSAWADASKLAKKAVKENKEATAKVTSSKSAKATEDLNQLFTYVEYNVFGSFIERNLALAQEVQKNGKPHQQVIKLYDDVLKNIEYIWDLPQVRDNLSLDGEMNVLTLYYKGCRCVQVALAYNDLQKIPESLALYDRAQGYVVQAKQALSQIRQFDADALLTVSQQDITALEQSIRAGTWKSRAAWYLEHGNNSEEAMEQKMQQLDLNNEGKALVNHLDTYPSHISQDRLVDFPPKFQPVACKPFYFDLAANFVKYPEQSLAERTGKQNTGGSGFWGIFGGRK